MNNNKYFDGTLFKNVHFMLTLIIGILTNLNMKTTPSPMYKFKKGLGNQKSLGTTCLKKTLFENI